MVSRFRNFDDSSCSQRYLLIQHPINFVLIDSLYTVLVFLWTGLEILFSLWSKIGWYYKKERKSWTPDSPFCKRSALSEQFAVG